MKNIEDLRRKSLEQFSELRKKALHESYRNAPIQIVHAAASGGGSPLPEPEPADCSINEYVVDDYICDYFV